MSDSLREDSLRALDTAPDPNRDAKIEELLLSGLDHYFAARYDHAINIWTRVLFLDRSHPRARAYIDRARGALAERQRASDELLESGVAAFHRGESARARRLLHDALDQGAQPEAALSVIDRLHRLEQMSQVATGSEPRLRPAPVSTCAAVSQLRLRLFIGGQGALVRAPDAAAGPR